MNKLNFNSQVCTTIEQSKRILALGLNPETADCYNRPEEWGYSNWIGKPSLETDIPAWSLHRLLEMLPYTMTFRLKKHKITLYDICRTIPTSTSPGNTYYDALINAIDGLIDMGKFNEKYLNE